MNIQRYIITLNEEYNTTHIKGDKMSKKQIGLGFQMAIISDVEINDLKQTLDAVSHHVDKCLKYLPGSSNISLTVLVNATPEKVRRVTQESVLVIESNGSEVKVVKNIANIKGA